MVLKIISDFALGCENLALASAQHQSSPADTKVEPCGLSLGSGSQ